jgi:hypothetical protein
MLGANGQVVNPSGTRLQPVDGTHNPNEGRAYGSFTGTCPDVARREPFLVVPMLEPGAPPTDYFCGA